MSVTLAYQHLSNFRPINVLYAKIPAFSAKVPTLYAEIPKFYADLSLLGFHCTGNVHVRVPVGWIW